MTATTLPAPPAPPAKGRQREPKEKPAPRPRRTPTPVETAIGTAGTIVAALLLGFLLDVSVLGHLREARDQRVLYSDLRKDLANATAPVGPQTFDGKALPEGAAMAVLSIPSINLSQVVVQGTASRDLLHGPGHRVDTAFPGQAGVSVIYGRRAGFGAPFGYLSQLGRGQQITVTTGQGTSRYRVLDLRRAGDPQPPPVATGAARLTLITAAGAAYLPDGVLIVDADLMTDVLPTPAVARPALTDAGKPLAGDSSQLIFLILWSQVLLVAGLALTWARHRFGARQAWVLGVPVMGFLGVTVSDQIALLLPNLT